LDFKKKAIGVCDNPLVKLAEEDPRSFKNWMRMDKCGFDVLRVKIKLMKRKTPSNEWESEREIACNVLQNWLSDPRLQHIASKRKRETRACLVALFFSPLQFLFHAK